MTIILTATNSTVEKNSLKLVRNIIQKHVDGLGIGETSVIISGDRHIAVSILNVQRDDMVKLIGSAAQLASRPVLRTGQVRQQNSDPDLPGLPTPAPEPDEIGSLPSVEEALRYKATEQNTQAFNNFECKDKIEACLNRTTMGYDPTGQIKYLPGSVAIIGECIARASPGIPQGQVSHMVILEFDEASTNTFSQMTTAIASKQAPINQFAVVPGGVVQSAPWVQTTVTSGQVQITGSLVAEPVAKPANILKLGTLPLNFEPSQVKTVSPTLGDEQLHIGLIVGSISLVLVIPYCLTYYRGLKLVVIGSLSVATFATYTPIAILNETMSFTLNPPATTGTIVVIGVTVDSLVICFERIRDEMRNGWSPRSTLTTGWIKARPTILVVDMVPVLSVIVLFILAVGDVKGFAFSLGLTTLLDLAVCFPFTEPLVQLLGRTKFFDEGRRFSGFDASRTGVSRDSPLDRHNRRTHCTKET